MSALDDFLSDLRAEVKNDKSKLAEQVRWLMNQYEPSLREEDADDRGLLERQSGDIAKAREHARRHVADLECTPEWLRPELRTLLHEGRFVE